MELNDVFTYIGNDYWTSFQSICQLLMIFTDLIIRVIHPSNENWCIVCLLLRQYVTGLMILVPPWSTWNVLQMTQKSYTRSLSYRRVNDLLKSALKQCSANIILSVWITWISPHAAPHLIRAFSPAHEILRRCYITSNDFIFVLFEVQKFTNFLIGKVRMIRIVTSERDL